MKLFKHPLLYFFILLLPGLHTFAQDSSSTTHTRASNNAAFQRDSSAWESYLRKNVDTMVPVRNGAKKGTYTVAVNFILRDGVISDVAAVTNHGYGMEEAVVQVMKKWSSWPPASPIWVPAQQNSKPIFEYHTVSFTFVVPKKKGLFGRRRN